MTVRDLIEIMAKIEYLIFAEGSITEKEAFDELINGYCILPKVENRGLILMPYGKWGVTPEKSLSLNTPIKAKGVYFYKYHDFGFNNTANEIEVFWWKQKQRAYREYELEIQNEYKDWVDYFAYVDVEGEEVIYGVDKKSFKYEKGLGL